MKFCGLLFLVVGEPRRDHELHSIWRGLSEQEAEKWVSGCEKDTLAAKEVTPPSKKNYLIFFVMSKEDLLSCWTRFYIFNKKKS